MRWLARQGYTGIRSTDWLYGWRGRKGLSAKPILLTFDDGYADLVEYALPVLRRYGFGGVVFVVTAQLGGANTWDQAKGSGTHRLMTAEQIRYWAMQGIEFGAHGRSHVDLTTLPPQRLKEEVLGGASDLAGILGSPAVSFAYPYGSYDRGGTCPRSRSIRLRFHRRRNHRGNELSCDGSSSPAAKCGLPRRFDDRVRMPCTMGPQSDTAPSRLHPPAHPAQTRGTFSLWLGPVAPREVRYNLAAGQVLCKCGTGIVSARLSGRPACCGRYAYPVRMEKILPKVVR